MLALFSTVTAPPVPLAGYCRRARPWREPSGLIRLYSSVIREPLVPPPPPILWATIPLAKWPSVTMLPRFTTWATPTVAAVAAAAADPEVGSDIQETGKVQDLPWIDPQGEFDLGRVAAAAAPAADALGYNPMSEMALGGDTACAGDIHGPAGTAAAAGGPGGKAAAAVPGGHKVLEAGQQCYVDLPRRIVAAGTAAAANALAQDSIRKIAHRGDFAGAVHGHCGAIAAIAALAAQSPREGRAFKSNGAGRDVASVAPAPTHALRQDAVGTELGGTEVARCW